MFKFRVAMMEQITSEERSVWRQMIESVDAFSSPLLHPEYIDVLDSVRAGVRVGMVHRKQTLCGILPFHEDGRQRGVPAGGEISDLHAFLSNGERGDLADWIRGFGLSRFDFDHLPEPLSDQYVFRREPWFRINLSGGYRRFEQELEQKSSFLSQARRNVRRLEKSYGPIQFTWDSYDPDVLDSLKSWKSTELENRGYRSPFRLPWVHGLINGLMNQSSKHCHGLLSFLRAGNQVISVHFGVANRTTLVSWLPCVNPLFSRYSPGNLLFLELAKQASGRGLRLIDLGRGENQTKIRMANDISSMAIGSVCSSRWNYRLLKSKDRLRSCVGRLVRSGLAAAKGRRGINVK